MARCFLEAALTPLLPLPPSLPAEVLLKILSYLDAAALLCAGCVSRRFYHLASDK